MRTRRMSFRGGMSCPSTATGDLVDSSMITELRTDTFHHWLEIAAEASANAETARTIAIEPGRDDNDTFTAGSSVSFERR